GETSPRWSAGCAARTGSRPDGRLPRRVEVQRPVALQRLELHRAPVVHREPAGLPVRAPLELHVVRLEAQAGNLDLLPVLLLPVVADALKAQGDGLLDRRWIHAQVLRRQLTGPGRERLADVQIIQPEGNAEPREVAPGKHGDGQGQVDQVHRAAGPSHERLGYAACAPPSMAAAGRPPGLT